MTNEKHELIENLKARGFRELIVIHSNRFSGKNEGGYVLNLLTMQCGQYQTNAEISAYWAKFPETPVDICRV